MERSIGVAGKETLVSMSGIEFLKAKIAGEVPAPPMAGFMALTLVEAEVGRAVLKAFPLTITETRWGPHTAAGSAPFSIPYLDAR